MYLGGPASARCTDMEGRLDYTRQDPRILPMELSFNSTYCQLKRCVAGLLYCRYRPTGGSADPSTWEWVLAY